MQEYKNTRVLSEVPAKKKRKREEKGKRGILKESRWKGKRSTVILRG